VIATNQFGSSSYSPLNTQGATIETIPTKVNTPTRDSSTRENELHLSYTGLTGTNTGGSNITSYIVLWDKGTSSPYEAVLGDSQANLQTSV
jgi:hypothetical protein